MAELAQESTHIQRARRKLQQMMESESNLITNERLREAAKSMRYWIDRHSKERLNLKEKSFRLFNENNNPAATSNTVASLRNQIASNLSLHPRGENAETPSMDSLKGRIALRYPLPNPSKTD